MHQTGDYYYYYYFTCLVVFFFSCFFVITVETCSAVAKSASSGGAFVVLLLLREAARQPLFLLQPVIYPHTPLDRAFKNPFLNFPLFITQKSHLVFSLGPGERRIAAGTIFPTPNRSDSCPKSVRDAGFTEKVGFWPHFECGVACR